VRAHSSSFHASVTSLRQITTHFSFLQLDSSSFLLNPLHYHSLLFYFRKEEAVPFRARTLHSSMLPLLLSVRLLHTSPFYNSIPHPLLSISSHLISSHSIETKKPCPFVRALSNSLPAYKKLLVDEVDEKTSEDFGCPVVLVVCSSAIRATAIIKSMSAKLIKCKIAKVNQERCLFVDYDVGGDMKLRKKNVLPSDSAAIP
jgi:hypothetical protein